MFLRSLYRPLCEIGNKKHAVPLSILAQFAHVVACAVCQRTGELRVQESNPASGDIMLSVSVKMRKLLIFFFCMLKLSMMTPMKRLRVKNDPKTMKKTK